MRCINRPHFNNSAEQWLQMFYFQARAPHISCHYLPTKFSLFNGLEYAQYSQRLQGSLFWCFSENPFCISKAVRFPIRGHLESGIELKGSYSAHARCQIDTSRWSLLFKGKVAFAEASKLKLWTPVSEGRAATAGMCATSLCLLFGLVACGVLLWVHACVCTWNALTFLGIHQVLAPVLFFSPP